MIYLRIQTLQPVCLALASGIRTQSANFVPGSTLRGALAAAFIKSYNRQDQRFDPFFLKNARFYPLFIQSNPYSRSRPLPLTAVTCKNYSGFKTEASVDTSQAHGIKDTLLALLNHQNTEHICADCNDDMEACEGDLEYYEGSRPLYRRVSVKTNLITRTALSPRRETAAERLLYQMTVLDEDQIFGGLITLKDDATEQAFMEFLTTQQTLRLGAARTRGQGLVEVTECDLTGRFLDTETALRDRLDGFNHLVNSSDTHFALTLQSECIARDTLLRYAQRITPDILGREINQALQNSNLKLAVAKAEYVAGWNTHHGMPKPTALAIRRGSVFVFSTQLPMNNLVPLLLKLSNQALGERQTEGFGWISVCDPWHLEVEPV